jgi:small subunit ribosomal protein S3
MGRKVHPVGFRLNINQPWAGRWYAEGAEYTKPVSYTHLTLPTN